MVGWVQEEEKGGAIQEKHTKTTRAKGKQMFSEYFKAQITLNKVFEKGGIHLLLFMQV